MSNAAKWIQIHTNGATTTFARFYEGKNEGGETTFPFEKMQVDTTGGSYAEVFGVEEYATEADAAERLRVAVHLGE
jgi:hypothetical protein